jgi:ferritin
MRDSPQGAALHCRAGGRIVLSSTMADALGEHLNLELYSSYLYLSMASFFDHEELPGFAHWMKIQVREELDHVVRVYGYIHDRGARVHLLPIQGPPSEWKSPRAAFDEALVHEEGTSARVHRLVDQALRETDHATHGFLQWFVTEQVEEEALIKRAVQNLKLVEGAPGGLFMIDQNLATRVYRGPATGPSTASP